MSFGRDFSNFSFFIKKHLDIFDRHVFYKLAVLTAIIIILVIFLGSNFLVLSTKYLNPAFAFEELPKIVIKTPKIRTLKKCIAI